ncbi:MAG: short-chain dehydrogenase [Mucilaginibacter sp.]|nr:short-chain dehydrogenase [Mucilaginibacter sp.]
MKTLALNIPLYPDLAGKVALVTGGSKGIGAETCRMLAANGVKVAVNGRDEAAINELVIEIRFDGGSAIGVAADCMDFKAIEQMRLQIEKEYGLIDILIANAGGGNSRPVPVDQITEEEWHSVIDGSLTATFLTIKSFLPSMVEKKGGSIITVSSSAARQPSPAPAGYTAAKAGIIMLSRQIANEVARQNIRVNCISPSAILTERTASYIPEERLQKMIAAHPLGRLGTPADVAHAMLFLASESSSWITGITLDIAGGKVMI